MRSEGRTPPKTRLLEPAQCSTSERERLHGGRTRDGTELRRAYGTLTGYGFARLCALCEPTWWLGRDFWPGLLLAWERDLWSFLRSPRSLLPNPGVGRLRELLKEVGESPARPLARLAVSGWEEGFPLLCEGYSSGLHFSSAAVAVVNESLVRERREWARLGTWASGHPPDVVPMILHVVAEAFAWATSRSLGLMEADEIVGAFGER